MVYLWIGVTVVKVGFRNGAGPIAGRDLAVLVKRVKWPVVQHAKEFASVSFAIVDFFRLFIASGLT